MRGCKARVIRKELAKVKPVLVKGQWRWPIPGAAPGVVAVSRRSALKALKQMVTVRQPTKHELAANARKVRVLAKRDDRRARRWRAAGRVRL